MHLYYKTPPTWGNSQLKFSQTISLAKTSDAKCTLSFDSDKVVKASSRPTWSELLQVAGGFASPCITGPMTPHQSQLYVRYIILTPAANLCNFNVNCISFNRSKNMTRVGAWVLGTRTRSTRVPNFSTRTRTQTTGNISTRTQQQSIQYSREYWLSTSSKPCQWYS